MKQQVNIDVYLLLGKVYMRLDQPLTSIEMYNNGLDVFQRDVALLTALARLHEVNSVLFQRVHLNGRTSVLSLKCLSHVKGPVVLTRVLFDPKKTLTQVLK